ncbi:MBL fold metallo-hydrolase [Leucobacter sp. UT-8R-CII-1-4]|uniref:MBL fold metallo-hydrolase n=1 Tax=Leucobacter sp. UT-8R-CII-1-4 TaxID=3040075 RepID=UPI0024A82CC4|nr:MBL fold metallo-hydrolase [Leucobacter sp. UT-8R-CII-1-4]MDI6023161.1 MBL fold metallo-hydrolase [Leucobacter sp. UT-8R-CII-1-4]
MQCFRLAHAGLVIEDEGASLFIDPGNFSTQQDIVLALASTAPPAAIVITHEHADHWDAAHIASILEVAPEAKVHTTVATKAALLKAGIADARVSTVTEGDRVTAGPFALDFYGRRHEVLHSSIPVIDNIGVRVNDTVAWGGDSLTRAPLETPVLGVPIGSPWSTVAQVMDFVLNCAAPRVFLTHDGMLSDRGLALYTDRVASCLATYGGELLTLPRLDEDRSARLSLG